MLPLDLHVLSLSLAFILSQDQTLRCWIVSLYLRPESRTYCCPWRFRLILLTLLYYLLICNSLSKNSFFFRNLVSLIAGAKVITIFYSANISEIFFSKSLTNTSTPHISLDCGCKSNAIKHIYQMFLILFFNKYPQSITVIIMYAYRKI